MGWAESQRRVRDRHWRGVEGLLDNFPPALSASFRLLQFNLSICHSSTGRFRDIFMGSEQPPVPWIAAWLVADSCPAEWAERDEVEQRLFVTSVLLASREHLVTALLDKESFAAADQLALAVHLSERVASEVTELSGGSQWLDHPCVSDPRDMPPVGEAPEAYLVSRWEQPMRMLASVATAAARPPVPQARLGQMIALMAAGFEVRRQLARLHADVLRGSPTFPITLIARAAEIPLRPWPSPEVILGAMVLTRSVPTILEESRARLREAQIIAEELKLRTLADFLRDAAVDIASRTKATVQPSRNEFTRITPLIISTGLTVPKAIAMARGFLLADPTFREAWECHREGMFGEDEVVSRFPTGLILEILATHGQPVTGAIDAFLEFTSKNRFRYYEHPMSGVDTDTIGVFLRLLRHSSAGEQHLRAARGVLACLERDVERSGAVPVWLHDSDERVTAAVINLGEDCGTVAAQLLLGLCSLKGRQHDHIVDVGARHLLEKILEIGLGVNANYPRTFALAAYLRLAARVRSRASVANLAATAGSTLRSEIERLRRRPVHTAQDAALLTNACLDADRPELLDGGWRETILKQQRFDGSWCGEPFAAAPNRGDAVTWYMSNTMTTALAYQALERWSGVGA
jgi:hypothetical protein